MKVIIGLGNPGMKYAQTRHNVGFLCIDRLCEKWDVPLAQFKWEADIGERQLGGEKVILCKPQTYMNRSGAAVRALMDDVKADIEDLVVIYDDLDLPPGRIRLRLKGGAGGHNGVKSVIQHLGTDQFKRIRIGIGRPHPPVSVTDYVLSPFARVEEERVAGALDRAVEAVACWLESSFPEAMNRYNVRP